MWGRAAPRLEILLLRRNTIFVILEKFFVESYFWVKFAKSVKAVVEDYHQSHSHSCSGYSGFSLHIHLSQQLQPPISRSLQHKVATAERSSPLNTRKGVRRDEESVANYIERRGAFYNWLFSMRSHCSLTAVVFAAAGIKTPQLLFKCLSLSCTPTPTHTHTVCISLHYLYRIHDMNMCNGLILQPFKNYSRVSKHCQF